MPDLPRRFLLRRVREIALYVVLCLLFPSGIGVAQAQTSSAPKVDGSSLQTAPSGADAASGALRVRSNLVLVDVVVKNHDGPVHGLAQSDFNISEDGQARPIAAFEEHRPAGSAQDVKSFEAQAAAVKAALPPGTYTNLPLYPDSGVVNVLLLDALNTPVGDQLTTRTEMIRYLGNTPPGTELAVFTLTNHLQLVEGFTTDAAKLAALMKSKATSPSESRLLEENKNASAQNQVDEVNKTLIESDAPVEATIQALNRFKLDLTTAQTTQRVQWTLDAFQQLARYLAAIPGRKNLIWFSGSFPITLDGPDADLDDVGPMGLRNVQDYGDQIRQTDDLLNAARVAVYPIDARGLMNSTTLDASYQAPVTTMQALHGYYSASDRKFLTQNGEEHQSLSTIAEETGGHAFYNTNDLKEAVAQAVADGSSFYTLGFVPRGKLDGRLRRIKVDVGSGHYDLSYRRGYYSDSSEKPSKHDPQQANLITEAALHGAPPMTQVLFLAQVLSATDPAFKNEKFPDNPAGQMAAAMKGRQLYVVNLTVDAHNVMFNQIPDGTRQAQVKFALVAYDADGKRLNFLDRSFEVNLKPGDMEREMKTGIHARFGFDLPPGHEFVRIAVEDSNAGSAGSVEIPVSVPAQ